MFSESTEGRWEKTDSFFWFFYICLHCSGTLLVYYVFSITQESETIGLYKWAGSYYWVRDGDTKLVRDQLEGLRDIRSSWCRFVHDRPDWAKQFSRSSCWNRLRSSVSLDCSLLTRCDCVCFCHGRHPSDWSLGLHYWGPRWALYSCRTWWHVGTCTYNQRMYRVMACGIQVAKNIPAEIVFCNNCTVKQLESYVS